MKKILISILMIGAVNTVQSQTATIDSLETLLKRVSSKQVQPETVDMMIQAASLLRAKDIGRANYHINNALKAARRIGYREGEVQAIQGHGVLHAVVGDLDSALILTKASVDLASRYGLVKFEARAYNNLGLIYQRTGRYQDALGVLIKSVELKKDLNDPLELAPTYNNIGVLYKRLANYEQAMVYYLKASSALEGSNDSRLKADVCNNIGNIAARLKDWDKAIKYNELALQTYLDEKDYEGATRAHTNLGIYYTNTLDSLTGNKHYLLAVKTAMKLGEKPALFYAYLNLGRYYHGKLDVDSSLYYYEKAYVLAHELNDMDGILSSAMGFSEMLAGSGQTDRALVIADSAMLLAKKSGNDMVLPELYIVKTTANRLAERYDEAFQAYADYVTLRDTLHQRERARQIGALEVQYGLQLTESENIRLLQDQKLHNLLLNEQQDRLADLEREQRVKELELARHKAELLLKEEEQARSTSALATIEKQRNIERLRSERQVLENRILIGGAAILGVFSIVLILLIRRQKRSEKREKEKSAELQQATGEILYHQQELEKKSGALANALDEIRERNELLEVMDKEKSEFLAIAAHDLKNPLSTIYGLSELIKTAEPGSDEVMECAHHISSSTTRMLHLVSNLLDMEMIESGKRKVVLTQVNLEDVIDEVLRTNAANASKKDISLKCITNRLESDAIGDQDTLIQILDNLVSNAVKFSPLGADVIIEAVSDTSGVRIDVTDCGPGLSEEEQQKLFKKFSRLSPRPTGGEVSNGLGLYIVSKLVESLGGGISCNSEVGRGATFRVHLHASVAEKSSRGVVN